MQSDDPDDVRSRIPALGHREYWYPALPAKDIRWDTVQALRLLGKDLVFFRGKDGQVKALLDACPHRGAYLSMGNCYFKGYISCPYHGATFDGDGNCVAMLPEGPESKMPGEMHAWPFPTVTVKGFVFVWMGEGKPVDPREDLPPEFFEPYHNIRWSCQMMNCNWIIALENVNDAHVKMVHRDNVVVAFGRNGGGVSAPFGPRVKILNNKTSTNVGRWIQDHYRDATTGHQAYQTYFPRLEGVWPQHRYRLMWTWLTDKWRNNGPALMRDIEGDYERGAAERGDDEWAGTRLPSISAHSSAKTPYSSHRWCVPVERDLTRVVYINIERYYRQPSLVRRFYKGATWPWRNWVHNYNFRRADLDAERTCQYSIPEFLSSTDSKVVVTRKLMAGYAREPNGPARKVPVYEDPMTQLSGRERPVEAEPPKIAT
jgi:nitrite reductase/ring-hydroxylating ferredoxin subunit